MICMISHQFCVGALCGLAFAALICAGVALVADIIARRKRRNCFPLHRVL